MNFQISFYHLILTYYIYEIGNGYYINPNVQTLCLMKEYLSIQHLMTCLDKNFDQERLKSIIFIPYLYSKELQQEHGLTATHA